MINKDFNLNNTPRGVVTPEIRDCFYQAMKELLADMPNGVSVNSGIQKQLLNAKAQSSWRENAQLQYLLQSFDPYTAKGVQLDNILSYLWLLRNKATATYVTLTLTGLTGTIIPKGTLLQNVTTDNFYQTQVDSIIPDTGHVTAIFFCTVTGEIECPSLSKWAFIDFIHGLDTANNTTGGILGRPIESDFIAVQRLVDYAATQLRPGGISAIKLACSMNSNVENYGIVENVDDKDMIVPGMILPPNKFILSVAMKDPADKKAWESLTVSIGADKIGYPMYAPINTKEVTTSDPDFTYMQYKAKYVKPNNINLYVLVKYIPYSNQPDNIVQLIKNSVYNSFYGLDTDIVKQTPYRCWIGNPIKATRFITALSALNVPGIEEVWISFSVPTKETPPDKQILLPKLYENPVLLKDNIDTETIKL